MIAILSDIHANLEALRAVLAEIRSLGIKEITCLGDLVGYGPDPVECVRLAREFKLTLKGNHDAAALAGPRGFSRAAAKSIRWTRSILGSKGAKAEMDLLQGLPEVARQDALVFVHGSPRNPLREYMYPHEADEPDSLGPVFAKIDKYAFIGHTHIPGVIEEGVKGFIRPGEEPYAYFLGAKKAIVNVGSVGQPRDGDPRASYVTFDGRAVVFRRVEYDIAAAAAKIASNPALDAGLGRRLQRGR